MEKDYDLLLYSNFSETRNRLVNTSSRIGLLFLIDVILLYVYMEYFTSSIHIKIPRWLFT